jgi:hypothetical protein
VVGGLVFIMTATVILWCRSYQVPGDALFFYLKPAFTDPLGVPGDGGNPARPGYTTFEIWLNDGTIRSNSSVIANSTWKPVIFRPGLRPEPALVLLPYEFAGDTKRPYPLTFVHLFALEFAVSIFVGWRMIHRYRAIRARCRWPWGDIHRANRFPLSRTGLCGSTVNI